MIIAGTNRRIDENKLIKKIFVEHFAGMVLIDSKTQTLINISDEIAGTLLPLVKFDKTIYNDQIFALIDRLVPKNDRERLKNNCAFLTVVSALKSNPTYAVEFNAVGGNNSYGFHRIIYRYVDEKRDFIAVLSEDLSDISSYERDPLTGLLNSSGFALNVKKWIAANPGRKYRLQRYNIDHFRDINGIYGHEIGDKLLSDIGDYMRKMDSKDSFSAHLSGDHFARFLADDCQTVEKFNDDFVTDFSSYKLKIPLTIHIGVYDLCEEGISPYEMSYKALLALQSVKGDMQNYVAYYESGMVKCETEQLELLNDVENAIKNEEFEIWFQPQVNYSEKSAFSAEALVRWRHPSKGILSPGVFVPILEKSNYISKLDKYVIEKTCKYMQKWFKDLPDKDIKISVNLSRNDLLIEGFADKLAEVVRSHDIPLSALHMEVTESAYIDNPERLIKQINNLREKGFFVEMDDFGAGFSSLNTLKDISVDKLKLDMKFLSGDNTDKKGKIIIASIIKMAKALGLPIIAEGVETKEQADMLLDFGCSQMQGYYFSKPIPASEYEKILYGNI